MGNANCTAANLSSESVSVNTYNMADVTFSIPCNRYTIAPGDKKRVEAAAHLEGLKVCFNGGRVHSVRNGGKIQYLEGGEIIIS